MWQHCLCCLNGCLTCFFARLQLTPTDNWVSVGRGQRQLLSNFELSWSTSRAFEQRAIVAYSIIVSIVALVVAAFVATKFEFSNDGFFPASRTTLRSGRLQRRSTRFWVRQNSSRFRRACCHGCISSASVSSFRTACCHRFSFGR